MTLPFRGPAPTSYRLRILGHWEQHWSPSFGDLALSHDDDGTTSLTGAIADQAELHGLLTKIRDLGVPLLSLSAIVPADVAVNPSPETAVQTRVARRAGATHAGSQKPADNGRHSSRPHEGIDNGLDNIASGCRPTC